MVIGVDAGALSITDERLKVGVYRVTLRLLQELTKLDPENTYRLYSFAPIDGEVMKTFGSRTENKVITPASGWAMFWLPLELKRHPVDVFLGTAQAIPPSTSHNIGFIYDLAFLHARDAYGYSYHQLKNQTEALVTRANHIITISHASASDIVHEYHVPPEKISVCYPGVDNRFTLSGPVYHGPHPYFLFVGSLNKAKDIPLAIESFALFLKKVKNPYDFLLIGGDYWPDPRIDIVIRQYKLEDRVKKPGFISDEELPKFYRGATAFFTTAIREGFCLPAVESMACGTPVVSAPRGAMKEVVGDGGIIAASLEPSVLADALLSVATNEKLLKTLKDRAQERAKTFSWEKFAQCIYSHINTLI